MKLFLLLFCSVATLFASPILPLELKELSDEYFNETYDEDDLEDLGICDTLILSSLDSLWVMKLCRPDSGEIRRQFSKSSIRETSIFCESIDIASDIYDYLFIKTIKPYEDTSSEISFILYRESEEYHKKQIKKKVLLGSGITIGSVGAGFGIYKFVTVVLPGLIQIGEVFTKGW